MDLGTQNQLRNVLTIAYYPVIGGPENGQHQPKVQIGQQKNQPDPSLDYALHFFSLVILQAFMSISEISNPLVTHIPILMPQVNVM